MAKPSSIPPKGTRTGIPLGTVIAERRFALYEQDGQKRQVIVRLGKPVPATMPEKAFRCPLQIEGLELDERIFAPFGEDPFVALQYAINLAGDLLDKRAKELALENRHRTSPSDPNSWIWRYDHYSNNALKPAKSATPKPSPKNRAKT